MGWKVLGKTRQATGTDAGIATWVKHGTQGWWRKEKAFPSRRKQEQSI